MFKALLVIALAFSLCQARPANLSQDLQEECGSGSTKCLSMFDNSDKNVRSVLKVERSWMETANKTVVPLLSVKRELIRNLLRLNESAPSLDEWSQDYAKRIVDSMTTEEKRRFVEPVNEFVERSQQYTREFAEIQEDDMVVRELDWTTEAKRVWKETTNGSVVPLKRAEWLQLLNDSVVAPVTRVFSNDSFIGKCF